MMANDNDSVDSNGNSTDLRPRRSNRSKGKPISQVEETDDNIVVNNVAYKVGDFAFYLDKKQDIYRIGLIEEFKFQKRDKLTNKKAEISLKQFYRLDEIPASVLSNEGEFDTHVMPQNFPEWLRLREIFISDNTLSTPSSSLKGMCTVRHFPDLNHAMALFSTTQSSNINSSGSPRVDHHSLINGKDGSIPIPKQRDDNTFFYVYSYNARGRKLAATYLEIRVGPSYQAELPELHPLEDQLTDINCGIRVWEQLMWKPNQIPEEVFNVYNMATISIACFSGFGGGVDDSASVENGRKIASHMLTRQKALDCLHKAQYNMEKAMEIFAENSLPETNKMPFLWTDEDHIMFDESVKIYGKNFLRINQDKRNKKCRLVGDFVTFYYYWKKNRPKNRKYTTKKNLRSRVPAVPVSEQNENTENNSQSKPDNSTVTAESDKPSDKLNDPNNPSPSDAIQEFCTNCKATMPKSDSSEEKSATLTERMRTICNKCQHYLRRYGHQRPVEAKRKSSDIDEDVGDFEDEGLIGFDEEEDEEEQEGEEDEDEEVFTSINSPSTTTTTTIKEFEDNSTKVSLPSSVTTTAQIIDNNKSTLAINKYDFDEEDENVEEVSSLLKRNQAKHNILRDLETKPQNFKAQSNGSNLYNNKSVNNYSNSKSFNQKSTNFSSPQSGSSNGTNSSNASNQTAKPTANKSNPSETQTKPAKRSSLLKGKSNENSKKRKVETGEENASNRSSNSGNRNILLPTNVSKQFHDSLKSNISHSTSTFSKKIDHKKSSITGQNDVPSSQYDSNSSSSSSTSSSNDSSSSDEGEIISLTKKSGSNVKFSGAPKVDTSKELSNKDTVNKEVDSSYNQMITAIPNLPGVCAVTNIGEPMPQMMQNISTDLSSNQSSSVPEINIALVEPHFMKLSLPASAITTTNPISMPPSSTISDCIFTTPKQNNNHLSSSSSSNNLIDATKMVNFNSISTQRIDNNPEETGLNLVKPKKRTENAFNEHNWAPPHDSPSKLVHHRGDNSVTEQTVNETPKQVNEHEIVRSSQFGSLVRKLNSVEGYGCARTDLYHTTSGLRPEDIEKRQQYINSIRNEVSSSSSTNSNSNIQTTSDVNRQKLNSMPPPTEKIHHSSTVKHLTTPPLSHSHSSISTSSINQSTIPPSVAHSRKISTNPSHTLRSPSPAGNNRSQSSFSSGSSNMIRSNHMHNSPLMSSSANTVNSIRPPVLMNHLQPVANNSLLMDYANMNKVANDLLIYQAYLSAHNYEEMIQKQEFQKFLMSSMPNMSMPATNNLINRAMWDQRDRFANEGWLNNMPPGSMPPPPDLASIMRAINQSQPANTQNRPRSATGLNLSNITNQQSMGLNQNSVPGSSSQSSQNSDKPGSGRASVNHISNEFQRQNEALTENPELLDLIRLMADPQMNPGMAASILAMLNLQKSASGLHHQQPPPPSAHGISNLPPGAGANFPNLASQHLGVQPSILSQIQAQSSSSVKPPVTSNFAGNGGNVPPRPNYADFLQLFQINGFNNRNQQR